MLAVGYLQRGTGSDSQLRRWIMLRARYVPVGEFDLIEREFDGEDVETLRASLASAGNVIVWIRPAKRWLWRPPARAFDVRGFCLELRALLIAGLGVVDALDALARTQADPEHRRACERVLDLVREGKSFSAALDAEAGTFSPLLRASIRAGEASGRLPESLDRFAQYLSTMARLRQSVVNASIYPTVVIGFGVLVVLFLLAYVVPRFAAAYETLPQGIAGSTNLLLSVAQFVGGHFGFVVAGLLLGGWLAVRWLRSDAGRRKVLRAVMTIGVVGRAVRAYNFARLFRTQSMMLSGGYTFPEALRVAETVVAETPWAAKLQIARSRIDQGKSVLEALDDSGFTNEITRRLVAAGMHSANLPEMLDHAAEHHERELASFVERASRLVEPILLMVVAGVIGFIVLIMYMPIFDLASTLR